MTRRTSLHRRISVGAFNTYFELQSNPSTFDRTTMDSGPAPEYAASVLEQDVKDVDIEIAAKETLALPALRPRPRAKLAPQLLALPHELLLHLLRYLTFADIERLRRTCKALRALASPRQIRILVGAAQLHAALLSHCKTCLFHDPFRSALLLTHPGDVGYPLSSRCVECAFYARDARFRAGAQVLLGNYESVWVCRWCGRPVSADAAPQNEKFHVRCYRLHHHMLLFFFLSGCLQLALGITGAALAWRFFRGVVLVFAPTVVGPSLGCCPNHLLILSCSLAD